jgi:hypothetical protein
VTEPSCTAPVPREAEELARKARDPGGKKHLQRTAQLWRELAFLFEPLGGDVERKDKPP